MSGPSSDTTTLTDYQTSSNDNETSSNAIREMKRMNEPATGDVYRRSRDNTYYQILYVDEQVVFLRSSETKRDGTNSHRIEDRTEFDRLVNSNYFEYVPDADVTLGEGTTIDWTDVPTIGSETAENLIRAGYESRLDIHSADDSELLSVDGIGEQGVEHLRKHVR